MDLENPSHLFIWIVFTAHEDEVLKRVRKSIIVVRLCRKAEVPRERNAETPQNSHKIDVTR